MRKRNNIFAEAFRWIKKNVDGIKYQKDLAARIGVSEDTITRIMRDQTEVTDDFLCKFNEAFNNVFNYQWLRGEDKEPMFAADLGKSNPHQSEQTIDESSQINAAISAYIQLTNRLSDDLKKKEIEMQERLAEKDATIESQKAQIARLELSIVDKDIIIKARDARIIDLERQLNAISVSNPEKWPFTVGVADEGDRPRSNI